MLMHDLLAVTNLVMPPPLVGRGIKRGFCLTSVCCIHRAYVENREA